MSSPNVSEIVEMSVCFGLILIYYVIFFALSYKRPYNTSLGVNMIQNQTFATRYLNQKPGASNILAVQALRNYMLSSSFLASSALFVAFETFDATPVLDGYSEGMDISFHEAKVLTLGLVFFLAFICFVLATRWAGQFSTLVSTPLTPFQEESPENEQKALALKFSERKLGRTKNRQRTSGCKMMLGVSISFSLGMRCCFLAFPIALWVVGTPGLWVGTFCVLSFHLMTDYVWHDDPAEEAEM